MVADKKIPKHILKELERLPWERVSKVEDILHLRALLEVCRRALTDKEYDYVVMDWNEGIVEYLVSEVLS